MTEYEKLHETFKDLVRDREETWRRANERKSDGVECVAYGEMQAARKALALVNEWILAQAPEEK